MELTYQTIIRLNLCAWPPKSINNLHFIDYYFIDRRRNRPQCGPLSGRRNFDRRSDGARVRASVESTVKRPKRIHSNAGKQTLSHHDCTTYVRNSIFELSFNF